MQPANGAPGQIPVNSLAHPGNTSSIHVPGHRMPVVLLHSKIPGTPRQSNPGQPVSYAASVVMARPDLRAVARRAGHAPWTDRRAAKHVWSLKAICTAHTSVVCIRRGFGCTSHGEGARAACAATPALLTAAARGCGHSSWLPLARQVIRVYMCMPLNT